MLDQLDFKAIADLYEIDHPECELDSNQIYICVWSMLVPNSVTANASLEELEKISMWLKEEGYYGKAGKRPKHFALVV